MDEIEKEDAAWQEEVRRQRKQIEEEQAAKAKFASMESPTAMNQSDAETPSKPKKPVTAADYSTLR